jgi:hypothetical protein
MGESMEPFFWAAASARTQEACNSFLQQLIDRVLSFGCRHLVAVISYLFVRREDARESGVNPLLPRNCEAMSVGVFCRHSRKSGDRSSGITHTLPRGKHNEIF